MWGIQKKMYPEQGNSGPIIQGRRTTIGISGKGKVCVCKGLA